MTSKQFIFIFVLISNFIFLGATCEKTTKHVDSSHQNKELDDLTDCIDPTKIDKDGICTLEYDPYCGCDGKTYGNLCQLEKSGVLIFTKGECTTCVDHSKINQFLACTKEYKPVCGCNQITYSNECMAKKAGLIKWTKGACSSTEK